MINDTSQRSVATWFRCGGTSFTLVKLLLSMFWNILNRSTFDKSWLPQAPCAPEHYPAPRWKLASDLTYGGHNVLHTRYVLLCLMTHADLYVNVSHSSIADEWITYYPCTIQQSHYSDFLTPNKRYCTDDCETVCPRMAMDVPVGD